MPLRFAVAWLFVVVSSIHAAAAPKLPAPSVVAGPTAQSPTTTSTAMAPAMTSACAAYRMAAEAGTTVATRPRAGPTVRYPRPKPPDPSRPACWRRVVCPWVAG